MTRQEVSQQIGSREFSVWEIIKLSGGLLFEHIGKWLLLAAIVFLPTGVILQYAAMQLPLNQLISLMQGENLETLYTMDWSPYLIYYGLQMGMNLIWIYCNLAVAVYTDRWLQSERQEMRFGEMLLTAVKRWPAGMLMPILLLLAVLAAAMMTHTGKDLFAAAYDDSSDSLDHRNDHGVLHGRHSDSDSGKGRYFSLPLCDKRDAPQAGQNTGGRTDLPACKRGGSLSAGDAHVVICCFGGKCLALQPGVRGSQCDCGTLYGSFTDWNYNPFYQSGTAGIDGRAYRPSGASGRLLMHRIPLYSA